MTARWRARSRPLHTLDGVAELRAFWEIIWILGGGLLMTMATVGAGIVGLTLLVFGAGSYWLRRRGGR